MWGWRSCLSESAAATIHPERPFNSVHVIIPLPPFFPAGPTGSGARAVCRQIRDPGCIERGFSPVRRNRRSSTPLRRKGVRRLGMPRECEPRPHQKMSWKHERHERIGDEGANANGDRVTGDRCYRVGRGWRGSGKKERVGPVRCWVTARSRSRAWIWYLFSCWRALNVRNSRVPAQRFVLCRRHSHLRCQKPCSRTKAFSVSLLFLTPANIITKSFQPGRATTRGTSAVRTILSVLGYADAHEGRNLGSGTPRHPLRPQPKPQSERLELGEGEDGKRGVDCATSDQKRLGWGESSASWIHSTYPLLPRLLSHAHVRSSGRPAIVRRWCVQRRHPYPLTLSGG